MRIDGRDYRAVWWEDGAVGFIDQRLLPHEFATGRAASVAGVAEAIRDMAVRGAPTIGVMAAYGLALAARTGVPAGEAYEALLATRPTAINLKAGLDAVAAAGPGPDDALAAARRHDDAEVAAAKAIGRHGVGLFTKGTRVLTHCNAGWLAAQDWGTATSPVYAAARAGLEPFVWVSETRPRLQGARLTAWELAREGIANRLCADGAAAQLLRSGQADIVITGADRIAANGDAANKIGTYAHALAARAGGAPFYVAAPRSTIDIDTPDGDAIPLEERSEDEVLYVTGLGDDGRRARVRVAGPETRAINPAFDVTPADLITGIITEVGIIEASREGIARAMEAPPVAGGNG